LRAHIELRHAPIGSPVLHHNGNRFAILVIHHQRRPQQIRPAFATARIGAVAKAAIHAEKLLAASNRRRIGLRMLRVRIRETAATSRGSTAPTAAGGSLPRWRCLGGSLGRRLCWSLSGSSRGGEDETERSCKRDYCETLLQFQTPPPGYCVLQAAPHSITLAPDCERSSCDVFVFPKLRIIV